MDTLLKINLLNVCSASLLLTQCFPTKKLLGKYFLRKDDGPFIAHAAPIFLSCKVFLGLEHSQFKHKICDGKRWSARLPAEKNGKCFVYRVLLRLIRHSDRNRTSAITQDLYQIAFLFKHEIAFLSFRNQTCLRASHRSKEQQSYNQQSGVQ